MCAAGHLAFQQRCESSAQRYCIHPPPPPTTATRRRIHHVGCDCSRSNGPNVSDVSCTPWRGSRALHSMPTGHLEPLNVYAPLTRYVNAASVVTQPGSNHTVLSPNMVHMHQELCTRQHHGRPCMRCVPHRGPAPVHPLSAALRAPTVSVCVILQLLSTQVVQTATLSPLLANPQQKLAHGPQWFLEQT
jgi:hypothetical protein